VTTSDAHSDILEWTPDAGKLPSPEALNKLGLSTFTAIDLETTGIKPELEEVIEWGAARFEDGRLESTFRTFVHPGRPVPEEITALTGITDQDLRDSPDFAAAYSKFLQFWEPSPVVGHHVDFDLGFLNASISRHVPEATSTLFQGRPIYDTGQLARALLPSEIGYGLSALIKSHKIHRPKAHRALEDATATGWLFLMLTKAALDLDFQTVSTHLRFLEGSRQYVQRFLVRLGNVLAKQELTRPIRPSVVAVPAGLEEIEDDRLPRQAPPWREEDYQRIFSAGGDIARAFPGFEERPQQAAMATAVHKSFRENRFLGVEAGTGTGKSLAYLAPALAWACANPNERRRVVVSTGTKNLQEQLFNKDLPDLRLSLPFRFRTALLKGRSNYLCLNRWKTILADPMFRLTPEERLAALPLVRWVQETRTGDLSEVSAIYGPVAVSLRSKTASDPGVCRGSACKESKGCFLQRARRRALNAHVVVVNHALLFSDVSSDGSVLGEYDRLIVDEAHRLEKAAVSHLGIEWSEAILNRPLNRLYQGGRVERGILTQMKQKLGVPQDPVSLRLAAEIQSVSDQVVQLGDFGKDFLQKFQRKVESALPTNDNGFAIKKRYRGEDSPFRHFRQLAGTLVIHYKGLINSLERLLELRKDMEPKFPFYNDDIAGELSAAKDELTRDRENFLFLSDSNDPNWVSWYEIWGQQERRWVKLQAAPLDVSGLINEALWKRVKTAVLTSATLAVGTSFDHFTKTVGLELVPQERREMLLLDSPFNLDRQMAILAPKYFPTPKNTAQYLDEVARLVKQVAASKRGTLVLFTSYQALNHVASMIRSFLEQQGITLLMQGRDGSPDLLLRRFRDDRSSVLFGTDSFWEGIDVVGEALEVLIVTRLPFDVPTDPWIEARNEQIEARGGNPFMEFSVPEAVIRLRQGVGRLIRTKTDRGVVMVTDSRMISTRFGRVFVDALPTATRMIQNREQMEDLFKGFWGG
jgi:predicted DnaQ family exonuclease/DinG family helicase